MGTKSIVKICIVIILMGLWGCSSENVDLFSQNEKCLDYFGLIEDRVKDERTVWNNVMEPIVFYSPVLDTCVGAYTIHDDGLDSFNMFDLFTNEHIYYQISGPEDGLDGWNEYESKQDELRST